jgi:hypothetical protein
LSPSFAHHPRAVPSSIRVRSPCADCNPGCLLASGHRLGGPFQPSITDFDHLGRISTARLVRTHPRSSAAALVRIALFTTRCIHLWPAEAVERPPTYSNSSCCIRVSSPYWDLPGAATRLRSDRPPPSRPRPPIASAPSLIRAPASGRTCGDGAQGANIKDFEYPYCILIFQQVPLRHP